MNEEEEKDELQSEVPIAPPPAMAQWPLTAATNLVWESEPNGQHWVSVVDAEGVPRWRYTYSAYLIMTKEAEKRGLY